VSSAVDYKVTKTKKSQFAFLSHTQLSFQIITTNPNFKMELAAKQLTVHEEGFINYSRYSPIL
jgi:hypothetical protein